jgi:hypothetical protein
MGCLMENLKAVKSALLLVQCLVDLKVALLGERLVEQQALGWAVHLADKMAARMA